MWLPERIDGDGPMYLQIAEALEKDIHAGRLAAGERLPTHRELARRVGVNVMTITRAYAEAGRRGLVEGEVGRGTFVSDRQAASASFARFQTSDDYVDFHLSLPAIEPDVLDLPGTMAEVVKSIPGEKLLHHYQIAGLPDHREAGARWVSRSGLDAGGDRIIVCGGAQHAMSMTLMTVSAPGDTILTEELTYAGLKSLASIFQLRLQGVEMDDEGLRPDSLDEACKRSGARTLYVTPTLQNPTGVIMSVRRREQLAEIIERHELTVVEDDTAGLLTPTAAPPLAALVPERTFYVTSLAKTVSAGLRVGYVLAPSGPDSRGIVDRITARVAGVGWIVSPVMGEAVTRLIDSGRADTMVSWKREEIAVRRDLLDEKLGHLGSTSHATSPHIWLPLPSPWRSDDFVAEARQHGVALTGSEAFIVGRANAPHSVRVCVATPLKRERACMGIARLATLLESSPGTCRSIV